MSVSSPEQLRSGRPRPEFSTDLYTLLELRGISSEDLAKKIFREHATIRAYLEGKLLPASSALTGIILTLSPPKEMLARWPEIFGKSWSKIHTKISKTKPNPIGRLLTKARKKRGWSQSKLGELAGIRQRDVSNIECGVHGLTKAKMEPVVAALKLDGNEKRSWKRHLDALP